MTFSKLGLIAFAPFAVQAAVSSWTGSYMCDVSQTEVAGNGPSESLDACAAWCSSEQTRVDFSLTAGDALCCGYEEWPDADPYCFMLSGAASYVQDEDCGADMYAWTFQQGETYVSGDVTWA